MARAQCSMITGPTSAVAPHSNLPGTVLRTPAHLPGVGGADLVVKPNTGEEMPREAERSPAWRVRLEFKGEEDGSRSHAPPRPAASSAEVRLGVSRPGHREMMIDPRFDP